MPASYLIVENILVYADGFKIECPTGSRIMLTLSVVADDARRQTGQLPLHA
jgi:hypothetical protein